MSYAEEYADKQRAEAEAQIKAEDIRKFKKSCNVLVIDEDCTKHSEEYIKKCYKLQMKNFQRNKDMEKIGELNTAYRYLLDALNGPQKTSQADDFEYEEDIAKKRDEELKLQDVCNVLARQGIDIGFEELEKDEHQQNVFLDYNCFYNSIRKFEVDLDENKRIGIDVQKGLLYTTIIVDYNVFLEKKRTFYHAQRDDYMELTDVEWSEKLLQYFEYEPKVVYKSSKKKNKPEDIQSKNDDIPDTSSNGSSPQMSDNEKADDSSNESSIYDANHESLKEKNVDSDVIIDEEDGSKARRKRNSSDSCATSKTKKTKNEPEIIVISSDSEPENTVKSSEDESSSDEDMELEKCTKKHKCQLCLEAIKTKDEIKRLQRRMTELEMLTENHSKQTKNRGSYAELKKLVQMMFENYEGFFIENLRENTIAAPRTTLFYRYLVKNELYEGSNFSSKFYSRKSSKETKLKKLYDESFKSWKKEKSHLSQHFHKIDG